MQILKRAVTPAAVQVRHERRPADRGEHRGVAAKAHVALGVTGMDGEFARRGLEQGACQPARNAYPLALHVRTRPTPQAQGFWIAPELDANLLENGLGVGLD